MPHWALILLRIMEWLLICQPLLLQFSFNHSPKKGEVSDTLVEGGGTLSIPRSF